MNKCSSVNLIGKNIVKCRKMNGMSQIFLAAKAGLTVQGLFKIEKGMVNTSVVTLFKISVVLGITPNQLFGIDPILKKDVLWGDKIKEKRGISMNKVILMGRLTRDPEVRYSSGKNALAIARYTLAVDRRFKRDGEATADFISCVVFGKSAEFAEKYFRQGLRITISGHIQTGSYTNKDGVKVYTTEVVIEEQEFAESKKSDGFNSDSISEQSVDADGFLNVPDGIDEELPFN